MILLSKAVIQAYVVTFVICLSLFVFRQDLEAKAEQLGLTHEVDLDIGAAVVEVEAADLADERHQGAGEDPDVVIFVEIDH